MTEDTSGQAEIPPELPDGQVPVAAFRRRRAAEEHALVVLSMKLPYWLYPYAGRFLLCVEKDQAEAVSSQIEKYRSERKGWPPRAFQITEMAPANPWAIGTFVLLMIAFFAAQQEYPQLASAGMMNTLGLLNEGQWWRPITALTLHADVGHLAGNLLSGICFGILVSRRFGYGLCWLLLLLSGIMGNILTAWFHFPEQHLALGASTALFGGLGILVGAAMQEAFAHGQGGSWKHSLIPLAGGVTVLGLTGIGEGNVDIFGHIYGFVSGLAIGLLAALLLHGKVLGRAWQALSAATVLVVIAIAWLTAI